MLGKVKLASFKSSVQLVKLKFEEIIYRGGPKRETSKQYLLACLLKNTMTVRVVRFPSNIGDPCTTEQANSVFVCYVSV